MIREIGKYPIASAICEHLQISSSIFRYLRASSDIFEYLQISSSIFRYLQVSSGICRHLKISSGICRHLQISTGIFRCEPHTNKTLTSHMEFTVSLPAPPGTHEALPEKPRPVSPWPGLAGPKACRLSVGRPGRLRTLIVGRFVCLVLPCRVAKWWAKNGVETTTT